jgi:hypothetical protein
VTADEIAAAVMHAHEVAGQDEDVAVRLTMALMDEDPRTLLAAFVQVADQDPHALAFLAWLQATTLRELCERGH